MAPADLPAVWRRLASDLAPYAPAAAEAFRRAAGELASALRSSSAEELTLAEASAESNYSPRRLREMLAEGTIPNAGRKGAPRVRRGDLPRRPARAPTGYDAESDARQLLAEGRR